MGKAESKKPKDDLIVLTGGAGFIGSCFLWKLNQAGQKNIIVVDHLNSSEKRDNLAGKTYTDYFEKDVFLRELKKGKLPSKVKTIFHIGACTSTTETDADYLQRNNYEYSKTLAEWAFFNNAAFYYASSAATYGDGSQGYSDEDSETLKLSPLNLYGRSKHSFDLWLIDKKLTSRVVGFKYFNVFGPNEYHKEDMRSLVVKAYEQIIKTGEVRLFKSHRTDYKDGEQKRDFVYVKDVINLMYNFYQNGQVKGIFNLGTGQARTWKDLANAIFFAMEMESNIKYIDMPKEIRDKYQYFTQADLNKLRRSGVAFSFTSLEAAVSDYVKNYLAKGMAHL